MLHVYHGCKSRRQTLQVLHSTVVLILHVCLGKVSTQVLGRTVQFFIYVSLVLHLRFFSFKIILFSYTFFFFFYLLVYKKKENNIRFHKFLRMAVFIILLDLMQLLKMLALLFAGS